MPNKTLKENSNNKDAQKKIKTFAWASFLNDLGADMIFPIWPIFITSILGANMSLLGLIDGIGEASVSISQALSGYLSDKYKKRKPFIWIGYLLAGTARLFYSLSTTGLQIIPARIMDRMGKIRDAPRDAIVADESKNINRGMNFGYIIGMDRLGAVFGIISCIILVNYLTYSQIFMIAAIPSILSALLVIKFIKEKKSSKIKIHKGIKISSLGKEYRKFLSLSAIFALGAFSYSFLIIFAKEAGFDIIFIPVLYLIYNIFAAYFSVYFGKLEDKIGRKKILQLSLIIWILTCLIFILTDNMIAIIITFILYGLHKASLEPSQKTIVSEIAPKKFKASALGGYQMVIGLCALPASVMAGLLWENFGKTAPFMISLILTTIAFFILIKIKETKKK